jgi:hypothetical protein
MQQSNIYLGIYTIEYYFLLEKSGCYTNISKLFYYTCMLRIGCQLMMLITSTWLIACLKVFKISCCRRMYPSPLAAFACLEV